MQSDHHAFFLSEVPRSRALCHGFRAPWRRWRPAAAVSEDVAASAPPHPPIVLESLRLAYAHPALIIANAVFAHSLVVIARWGEVPGTRLFLWWGIALTLQLVGVPYLHALSQAQERAQSEWVVPLHYALVIAAALIWASALWVLAPARLDPHGLVLAVVIAGALSSLVPSVHHLPTLALFSGIVVVAVAATLLRASDALATLLVVNAVGLVGMGGALARQVNRALAQALARAHQNAALARTLAAEKQHAEQAHAAKTRFLAAASHDLRQPLHTVGLLVDSLRARMNHPDDRRQTDKGLIDKIQATVEALEALIQGVLDLSKLDAGAVTPALREFPLAEVLALIQLHFAPQAEAQGLRFQVSRSSARVRSDPVLLERIVANLVANALRYTPRGRVLVRCGRRGDRELLQVWDSGSGIAPEHQEAIFQEFVQLANADHDRSQGLGLGLAIVKRLADLLGHEIHVRSQPGKGSCFSLSLPRVDADSTATLPPLAAAPPAPPEPSLAGRWIVVIDDEPAVRAAMDALLPQWGCQGLCVASAAQAAAALPTLPRPPDLVIADYRLTGEDGLGAIERLRRQCATPIPALLVTGDVAAVDIGRAVGLGVPIVHKPVGARHLRHLIGGLLAAAATEGRATAA